MTAVGSGINQNIGATLRQSAVQSRFQGFIGSSPVSNDKSSQKTINFSGRSDNSVNKAGKLIKSLLSTSISRRPRSAYSCNNALTKEICPYRARRSSRHYLQDGLPKIARYCVFSLSVCEPTAANLLKGNVCGRGRLSKIAFFATLCQR